jgi:hypothetical protein
MTTKRTKLPYWKNRQKSNQEPIQESQQDFATRVKAIAAKLEKILAQSK